MVCPKCNSNIPDGAKFCPQCGLSFSNQIINPPPFANQPQFNNQPPAGQQQFYNQPPFADQQEFNNQPPAGQQQFYNQPPFADQQQFSNQIQREEPIRCPKCGSFQVEFVTYQASSNFSKSDACCGYLLCGPIGLLCGAKDKTEAKTVRKCKNCGHEF